MAARQNRVASVFFTVASHAAETHPPRPRPSALRPLCLTRDDRLGVARPTASGVMRYTFSTNFVLVRRLVRRSAKRVGGSSLERRWKLGAEARGLGFVTMHDGVFKQRIQPLDLLNRFVSLWHRHNVSANLCVNQRGFFAAAQLIT